MKNKFIFGLFLILYVLSSTFSCKNEDVDTIVYKLTKNQSKAWYLEQIINLKNDQNIISECMKDDRSIFTNDYSYRYAVSALQCYSEDIDRFGTWSTNSYENEINIHLDTTITYTINTLSSSSLILENDSLRYIYHCGCN